MSVTGISCFTLPFAARCFSARSFTAGTGSAGEVPASPLVSGEGGGDAIRAVSMKCSDGASPAAGTMACAPLSTGTVAALASGEVSSACIQASKASTAIDATALGAVSIVSEAWLRSGSISGCAGKGGGEGGGGRYSVPGLTP